MKPIQVLKMMMFILPLGLASCGSHRNVQKGDETKTVLPTDTYKKKVLANAQKSEAVTAKMKFNIQLGEKDISVGGSLKMKRDDVIQLSLSFLGMEVGRMEFTKNEVLIVDRFNKQYMRVPYSQVSFLKSANLDFYTLQALFWNELFVPGVKDVNTALNQFTVASSGDHTLLSLHSAPQLDYSFLTITQNGLIDRTSIISKNILDKTAVEWRYGSFTQLGGRDFPQKIEIRVSGLDKDYTVSVELSSLNNSKDWATRTEVPSKYSQRNIDDILKKLMSL